MKLATLGIIVKDGKLLLGEKKKGEIGVGVLSGPGGKCETDETLIECLVRETREELDIELDPTSLELVALIDFYNGDTVDFRVYVYRTEKFSGEVCETTDMIPGWYPVNALPFDRMYEADRHWFHKAASAAPGTKFMANVFYRERAKKFDRIEMYPG